ncbi:MAG: winged helix-turn-helix domain-containing protein [Candidatus Methanomethylophilaceae archaeon]|nr:winged helix-turn-helix domain-containing protein [Candidatus Methanomethylophilaceae archaeon]NLF33497.1 winged helix-turn-helix transcriptional regulator [Thermoplasmatales archaeon]
MRGLEIYSTEKGLIQVSNEVRLLILKELSQSPMSPKDMCVSTGRAMSTVSSHLKTMLDDGLVVCVPDPDDGRRRVYSLAARPVAASVGRDEGARASYLGILERLAANPVRAPGLLLNALTVAITAEGINLAPVMENLGSGLADSLADEYRNGRTEDVLSSLRDFYEYAGIGEASIFSYSPVSVITHTRCETTFRAAEAMGRFTQGFFSRAMGNLTGKEFRAVSSEVFGAGNNYHRFTLEQVPGRRVRIQYNIAFSVV